ncbi:MAG: peptide chain release factor N(5)-glutamine methyltransferase [Planctomycetaceae bacterium]
MSASSAAPSAESAAAEQDIWTVRRILEWTTGFLRQKGIESPRLEAEILLAHARGCPRIRLYTDFNTALTDAERSVMRELVTRRSRREPIAYLVGHREFYGRSFHVTPAVLIPRPETETLIDVCLELIPADHPAQLIEVGIGSGCIAITLARQRPFCRLTATDVSPAALQIAAGNAARHEVADRITLLEGNALQPLLSAGILYDGLVSNPPYVTDGERGVLQPEIDLHEPAVALYGGSDGLDVVRSIITHAPSLLKPGAFIAFELDPLQCAAVSSLLADASFKEISVRQDMAGRDRIVQAVLESAG